MTLAAVTLGMATHAASAGQTPDLGPGFGVSGNEVSATASATPLVSDEDDTSVPGGQASAAANYSACVGASASAAGTGITTTISTDFSGGGGAVSAGGGFKQLFPVGNNPSDATIPLTFNFTLGGLMFLMSRPNQGDATAASVEALVGAGASESIGSFTLESIAGWAPTLVSSTLWNITPDASDVRRLGVSGWFAVTANASQSVVALASLAVSGEVVSGYTYDEAYLDLTSVTVPDSYSGPLPVLYGPGGTVIDVQYSDIDEPAAIFLFFAGVLWLARLSPSRHTFGTTH